MERALFLYSHGYVPPGTDKVAVAAPGVDATAWLIGHRFKPAPFPRPFAKGSAIPG